MQQDNIIHDYIELDRRFEKVERTESGEAAALRSYTTESLFGRETGLDWTEILKNRLVVVLGEPGSGKTWEFMARATLLNERGEPAFYIRLDQLTRQSLQEALGAEGNRRFRSWLRSEKEGTFFLDSVDEAKFSRLAEFYEAIEKFARALKPNGLEHAKILLSSRISEWQPESDAREVLFRLGMQRRPTVVGLGHDSIGKRILFGGKSTTASGSQYLAAC